MNIIKSKITAILAVIMAACVAFVLVGCNNDYTVEDAVGIARNKYGCTKILWVSRAKPENNVLEEKLPMQGGYYVVGIDKNGNEVCVVVPKFESKYYKTATFEWRFDYTFSQIAKVFAKYGYKYANGIDGVEKEYFYNHSSTYISLLDRDDNIKQRLGSFGDADEMYDKLDVKLVFEYNYQSDDEVLHYVYLVQEGGTLVVYETANDDSDYFTVTPYDKDDI